jgi:hypothetical protein
MRSARGFGAILSFCLVLSVVASAQVTTADILGRVADSSGAVLPGATVTIENSGTRDVRTTTTSETGDYVFTLLPIGTYTIRIELQGFQTQAARLTLASGDRARLDGKLQLGSLSETVQVSAEAPLLQTDTSTVSTLFTEKAVQDLPVNGRNIIRLIQMVPGANEGAVSSTANGTRPDDRRQTSAVSVNGTADTQNNQLIDGLDNNERAIGTVGIKPSIDAIAEVRVQTNLYSAETGRTLGGVINILTKSGTNQIHGTAFEFLRNQKFDSRSFFARSKPKMNQHQFGGSVGGPLRTDRTFYFVDYEGFRSTQGVANLITVPTARMRAGDFSELPVAVYDPLSSPRVPFAGNVIPANRLDPIAMRYMALYPLPNNGAQLANNYSSVTDRTQDMNTADVRIDHRFNGSNALYARYSYNGVDTFTPGACPIVNDIDPNCIVGGIGGGGAFPGANRTTAHNAVGSYMRVFSPTLIAEFKGGYNFPKLSSLPANYQKNLGTAFGIPNTNFDAMTSGFPYMFVTDYAHLGDAQAIPLTTQDQTKQIAGTLSKSAGAHNLKAGASVVMRRFSPLQSIAAVGVWTFNSQATNGPGGVGGNSVASFLLGVPSTVVRTHNLPAEPWYHTNEPGVYVQDDWRATSNLTVNLGVRYDVFTPFTEEQNQIANFDVAARRLIVAGRDGASESAGVKTDYSNIAPRFGFSATLPAQMVLRGGYGISYFPGNTASPSYLKNPPFTANYSATSNVSSGLLPNVRLADGLPPLAANDPVNLSGNLIGTAPEFKSNRAQQFNLMVEKEFAGNVVSAGYVGTRGTNIAASPNINLAPAAAGAVQPRRLLASTYPNVGSVQIFDNVNESTYDALQIIFQRRYRAGLSFNTHYTLAHAQTLSPTLWDLSISEWSDSPLDIRHRWVITANYELPWARGRKGVSGALLAGWQVNTVAFYQTGLPFTVTNSAARTNTGGSDRPNMTGDPSLPGNERTLARWFNTSVFAAQPQFTAGDAPATTLHGPPNRRIDLSLFKDFAVREDVKLQLRAEVYNLTNTANFINPNSSFGSPAFGTISSTGNSIPRQMQFAMKLIF